MTRDRCCRTCSAFQRDNHEQGTCHAKGPLGVPQVTMNPITRQPEMRLLAGWPPVKATEWCRDDWKPAHELTN